MINKYITVVSILLLGIANITRAQNDASVKVERYQGGFKVSISNIQFDAFDKSVGNYIMRDYKDFTDPSAAGTPKLPSLTYTLALPERKAPMVTGAILKDRRYEGIIPSLQPRVIAAGDSSYILEDVDYRDGVFRPNPVLFEVSPVFKVADYYAVNITVYPVTFDYSRNVLQESRAIEILVDLDLPGQYPMTPFIPETDFQKNLQKLFVNSEYIGGFASPGQGVTNDTTGNWIDYSASYLKFKIGKDGVYRITAADFQTAGINISAVAPAQLKLYSGGKERPIYVKGEGDGIFNADDYIEFPAMMNYNLGYRKANSTSEPYIDYLNKYSDSTIWFLTWNSGAGKRMPVVNQFNGALTDSLNHYTHFEHQETNSFYQQVSVNTVTNQDPESQSNKLFIWSYFGEGEYSYTFTGTDLVPNKYASVFFKVISGGSPVSSNSHKISVKINNTTLDSTSVNRNEIKSAGGYFSSNLLSTGTNTYTFINHPVGLSPNYFVYDWIEYEYPRQLKLQSDSLMFVIRDTLALVPRIITVANASAPGLLVYKMGDNPKRFENYNFVSGTIRFNDTVNPNDRYIIIPEGKILKPAFEGVKTFTNLRSNQQALDYIAITNPVLRNSAEDYVDFISGAYNNSAALVFTNDIFDEFSFGYPDPNGIKNYLKFMQERPGVTRFSYVTLIGSAGYDFNRYFYKNRGYEVNPNLVPSYAEPVSDTWYAMLDSLAYYQSFYIGRLPAKSDENVYNYLTKHQQYLNQRYDRWNKQALFFSSGDGNNQAELLDIRASNQFIINNYTNIKPFVLSHDHFYKTVNPASDFGPFTPGYIRNSILEGGLFISYLGHSGTRTWDNSISDPSQLLNRYNKSPLVTDFGCSTNKFAEPDVEAFGALFINEGQTIAYVGNSSLGFTSTSLTVSKYFYESILKDSVTTIGRAHFEAKRKMFTRLNSSGVYKIFAFTNLLMGDPIVNLALPTKPNLQGNVSNLFQLQLLPDDQTDSVQFRLVYNNLGSASSDSFSIRISSEYENVVNAVALRRVIPNLTDTVLFSVPVKSKPGVHSMTIELDALNEITELYEDDNIVTKNFTVASLSLRPLTAGEYLALSNKPVKVLNTALNPGASSILFQYAENPDFTGATEITRSLDTFYTGFDISGLPGDKRYWSRIRLVNADTLWSSAFSFIKSTSDYNFFLEDKYSFDRQELPGLKYDGGLILSTDTIKIEVTSGGGNFSKFGSITKNGINLLSNTFGWGMGAVVFDGVTLQVDTARTFSYGAFPEEANQLAQIIEDAPNGKLIALCVIDDGSSNITNRLINAIKSAGGTLISNLGFRTPYLILGKKGGAPGSAIERLESNTYANLLIDDSTFYLNKNSASFETPFIKSAAAWKNLLITGTTSGGSQISVSLLGKQPDGRIDTVNIYTPSSSPYSIGSIDNSVYPELRMVSNFTAGSDGSSPVLKQLGLSYAALPELGINYQGVSILKDTMRFGENQQLLFTVTNAGDVDADSVKVRVEITFADNTSDSLATLTINRLSSGERKNIVLDYFGSAGPQSRTFKITIDPENRVKEFFEDNNSFSVPFYLKADTTAAFLSITESGKEFYDGDLLPGKPVFTIELNDASLLPLNDPAFMKIYLNDEVVPYSAGLLEPTYSTTNPKMKVVYTPNLTEGTYELRVEAKDALGNAVTRGTTSKTFAVSNKLTISNLYNYPNPVAGSGTHFTFVLAQIPEKLEILVYTIAGRQVRALSVPAGELKTDFNKIYWDSRDEEGDLLANGVYLYTVKITGKGEVHRQTGKLAITR